MPDVTIVLLARYTDRFHRGPWPHWRPNGNGAERFEQAIDRAAMKTACRHR